MVNISSCTERGVFTGLNSPGVSTDVLLVLLLKDGMFDENIRILSYFTDETTGTCHGGHFLEALSR